MPPTQFSYNFVTIHCQVKSEDNNTEAQTEVLHIWAGIFKPGRGETEFLGVLGLRLPSRKCIPLYINLPVYTEAA